MRSFLCFATVALLLPWSQALAAPSAQIVDASLLKSTKISYKIGSSTKSKTIYCLSKTPGTAKSATGGVLFTPVATTIAKLKANKVTGIKLQTQLAIKKAGSSACSKLESGGTVPTPSSGATPTPTFRPSNFNGNGDVTASGKEAFGIPSSASGNISTGRTLSNSYCSCHGEKIGLSFPTLRAAIAQSPMFFDSNQISDDMLASITAYLNRFDI